MKRKVIPENVWGYFYTECSATEVAKLLQVDRSTIRYWWEKKYGVTACELRAKKTLAKHAAVIGRANRRPVTLCIVVGCGGVKRFKDGYCQRHHQQLLRLGDTEQVDRRNRYSVSMGTITKAGYRMVIVRIGGVSQRVFEHRYVMGQALGRALRLEESVHHLNGDRLDNRLENLELWSSSQPIGQRATDLVKWALQMVSLYT